MKWGVWLTDLETWLLDGYTKLSSKEWEGIPCKYKTRKEASQECAWLNKFHKGDTYVPRKFD